MLGIGAAPSALLALMVFVMPESPRWLVKNGRLADARAVLEKTSGTPEEAAARLADIKAAAGIPKDVDGDVVTVPKARNSNETQVWKELILSPTPAMRWILLSALGIHFFQQASGIDSVVLYSPRVFKSAGITSDNKLLGTTCAVGVTKTLFILVAVFLLDRVGRRPLLLCSAGGMMVSLLGLGTGLTVVGHHPGAKIPWAVALSIASTLAYVAFFSIGLGPITGVYTSEIFPLQVRALGFGVGVACNRLTSGVISMTFLSLSKAITIGGSFFLYAGIAALGCVFFFTYLPETRGRTLEEEMGKLFGMADSIMADQGTRG
jgi:sugar porter (SP) family MFS transporter